MREREAMASISAIRAMGQRDATKLRKSKVRTTEALLRQASTRTGRSALSERTGIPTAELVKWAHQADLMRVDGIGPEYADLLACSGVDTIKALRRRNAANLMATMTQVNTKKRIVQRLPTVEMVQGWVDDAAALDPIVTS
jgi:predicted flap endonuclease-1-like 5' DNA nuclease